MSEHSERELLGKTAKGAGCVVGWRACTHLLGLFNTLLPARLLMPTDFSLIAMTAGFVGAIDALSAFGVEEAVIRETNPRRDLFDMALTLNLIRGGAAAAMVIVSAMLISEFFNEPRLGTVLLVLGVGSC